MKWPRVSIRLEDGREAEASAPVIVSASRATDIPAFYGDWLMDRLRRGYAEWKNPFSGKTHFVSFARLRIIVFWTKNPRPFFRHLDTLDRMGIGYYFLYTLNDYHREGWEPALEAPERRVEVFQALSLRLGPERVIWRFDPYILTPQTPVDVLLDKTRRLGDALHPYTRRLVFSFLEPGRYRKVDRNLRRAGVEALPFTDAEKLRMAEGLNELNRRWGLKLAACAVPGAEKLPGITPHKCIDDDLLAELFADDAELMRFLGVGERSLFPDTTEGELRYLYKVRKDPGQREACGCIPSKDIGRYDTCAHGCVYCYANSSPEKARENYRKFKTAGRW
ncbi:MAG: DUF1848 domain-containing protein [Chlorobi bacterium]|nr:DUF1848 domain-containing protein [Chlorobiota bacterium]